MDNSITIRTANMGDLETLLNFEQGIIETEKPLDPFLGNTELYYYNIPEMIAAKHTHLVVAIYHKKLIASGYVRIENSKHYHKNPKHGYIGFMYVKPEFRGKKISNFVLDSLKGWAKEKKLNELRLDVYNNNFGAIKSYERFGFTKSLVNMRIDI